VRGGEAGKRRTGADRGAAFLAFSFCLAAGGMGGTGGTKGTGGTGVVEVEVDFLLAEVVSGAMTASVVVVGG